MNEDNYIQYLVQLRKLRLYDPDYSENSTENAIIFVYTAFGAHHTTKVMVEAMKLNTHIIKIP